MRQGNEKNAELQQKPPSEREMGVALYPGAIVDTEETANGSMSPLMKVYYFYSADELDKVKTFYEQKAGHKGTQHGNATEIVIKQGANPKIAERSVTVQPAPGEQQRSGMKTEIAIRHFEMKAVGVRK